MEKSPVGREDDIFSTFLERPTILEQPFNHGKTCRCITHRHCHNPPSDGDTHLAPARRRRRCIFGAKTDVWWDRARPIEWVLKKDCQTIFFILWQVDCALYLQSQCRMYIYLQSIWVLLQNARMMVEISWAMSKQWVTNKCARWLWIDFTNWVYPWKIECLCWVICIFNLVLVLYLKCS